MAPRILAGSPSSRPKIVSGATPSRHENLTFSFKYWKQIKFFGLSKIRSDWFVDLLDRLKELNRFTREQWDTEVLGNRWSGGRWHYHLVNWSAPNIPITKADLDWVPKHFLEEPDFGLWQLGLGASGGRIIGFWERDHVFAIVLCDPLHNMWPSATTGYRVSDCDVQPSSAEMMHLAIDDARRSLTCSETGCNLHSKLAQITSGKKLDGAYEFSEAVVVGLTDQDRADLQQILETKVAKSIADVVRRGLDELLNDAIRSLETSDR